MINLTPQQREDVGLNFILRHLNPETPYGVEKAKKIAPQTNEGVEISFDNTERIMDFNSHHLSHFKNIRGCVEKAKSLPLNEVELFEIKSFLLTLEKLLGEEMPKLQNINFIPMDKALDILDPQNQRLAPFSLQSPTLSRLRHEKERLERMNLMEERAKVVLEEDAEEQRVMETLTTALRPHIPAFLHNMEAISNLDLTIAKARLAKQFCAIRPTIGSTIKFKGMTNPYFADILSQKGKSFTEISIEMPNGITIITGANMGGKSMAIKTSVLNVVLCQLGLFVFAETAQIPIFNSIHLIAEDAQSPQDGLSTFGSEITRINTAVTQIDKGFTFIAMDEPARGTNPAEATAIAQGITAHLAGKDAISLMSTHYDRITPLATAHYRVAGITPEGNMDYTLHPADISEPIPKNALDICEKMGLDTELLNQIKTRI